MKKVAIQTPKWELNLNKLIIPGMYIIWENFHESMPQDALRGVLFVLEEENKLKHEFISEAGFFIRYQSKNGWGKWEEASVSDIKSVIQVDGPFKANELIHSGWYLITGKEHRTGLPNKNSRGLMGVMSSDNYDYAEQVFVSPSVKVSKRRKMKFWGFWRAYTPIGKI